MSGSKVSTGARAAVAACIFATIAMSLALAAPTLAHAAGGRQAGDVPVSLVITSVTPAYARPGQTVTVRGSITNTSSAALAGISVRLRSSDNAFGSRDALQEYAEGLEPDADSYAPDAATRRPISLAVSATRPWSATLRVSKVGMTSFGVYPLAAEADNSADTALPGGTSRTFLPFWPAKHGQLRPLRQEISWIVPLIDQPQQGPCPGPVLLNNSLATSLAPGGRLGSLLAAGQAESASTQLTWAVDPSLLASAQVMTGKYQVSGSSSCTGSRTVPASRAAAAWLAGVRRATAGQNVFVTPYADVDIAALTRKSLDSDLTSAFTLGRSGAASLLGRSFSPAPASQSGQAAAAALNGTAWPADGLANRVVLEDLAANKVSVVVLDSLTMPGAAGASADSAVTSTPDFVNGYMRVLLADDTITQLLASANSPADAPGTAFAVRQRFLAETAMITAQAPFSARSIVVAPPRRWNPPAGLAESLLAETASAPWLKPVSLGQLATAPLTGQPGPTPHSSARGELSGHVLRQIRSLDQRVALLQSILVQRDPTLSRALAGVESSAWRGAAASRQAQAMLNRVKNYVTSQEQGLTITKPLPVTMGGLKGSLPVTISSQLNYPVQVRLQVSVPSGAGVTISRPALQTIRPHSVVNDKLNVHAATVGSRTIRLSLLTPAGKELGTTVTMTIRATQFGTLALVILAAALGIFMITSAARAIRQGGAAVPAADPSSSGPGGAGGAGGPGDPARGDSVAGDHADEPGPAGPQPAEQAGAGAGGQAAASASHEPTEDTDELARAPGWADRA